MNQDEISLLNAHLERIVERYHDIPVNVLFDMYAVNSKSKNSLSSLADKLLCESGIDLSSQKVIPKSVHLDKYSGLKESMSFKTFKYYDIVSQDWENSDLRRLFSINHFLFIVYQDRERKTFLNQILIWKFPEEILDADVRDVWEKVKSLVSRGQIVKYIDDNGRFHTFLPSSSENPYVHVRPHAQSRDDTYPLPTPDCVTGMTEYPKYCFWLNRSYILKILSREGR